MALISSTSCADEIRTACGGGSRSRVPGATGTGETSRSLPGDDLIRGGGPGTRVVGAGRVPGTIVLDHVGADVITLERSANVACLRGTAGDCLGLTEGAPTVAISAIDGRALHDIRGGNEIR